MQNNQNKQKKNLQKKENQLNNSFNKQQQNNLFQFEMGNELGADIEQNKNMFKNEYCKEKKQNLNPNNHLNTKKNQFK